MRQEYARADMKWLASLRNRSWERRLSRLNHILIPDSAPDRARLRERFFGATHSVLACL